MERDLTTPVGKQICEKFDSALAKANWPAEKLFTREEVKSFMASAARQSLENVIAWFKSGKSADRIEQEIVRLISQERSDG
jgi:hypothetical protein